MENNKKLDKIIENSINGFLIKETIEDEFKHFIKFILSTTPNVEINKTNEFNIEDEIGYDLFYNQGYMECECDNEYEAVSPFIPSLEEISSKYNLGINVIDLVEDNFEIFYGTSVSSVIEYINETFLKPNNISVEEFKQLYYKNSIEEFKDLIDDEFTISDGSIYCERGINIKPTIRSYKKYNGVGVCWTYSEGYGTSEYGGGEGDEIVLIGSVPFSSVDWRSTFWLYRNRSHDIGEHELRLKPNAPIYIHSIIKRDTDEEYTFPSPIIVSSGSYYKYN